MQFLGYSERGFVNAFFDEVFRHPAPADIIRAFLALARWPLLPSRPAEVESASVDAVLIEQSFSDFGDAAVLLLASTPQGKASFFCEAKRGSRWTLKKEWGEFKARFQNDLPGGVSNVFRQLHLKQRLAQGLVAGDDLGVGVEFDGALRPARGDRVRKIGRNKVVLKAAKLLKAHVGTAYYLILTPEPWRDETAALFQDIQSFGPAPCDPRPRAWDTSRWGVISLRDVVRLCEERRLDHAAVGYGNVCSISPHRDYGNTKFRLAPRQGLPRVALGGWRGGPARRRATPARLRSRRSLSVRTAAWT